MLTVSEYARARGVSHQYISRLAKRGMPLSSFEAADLWRETHASSKPPTNPTRIARMMDEASDSRADKPRQRLSNEKLDKELSGNALERAITNTHQAADEAWRLLHEAMIEGRASKIQPLLSVFNKAIDGLFTAESAYREELERRRTLIPLAEAMEMTRRAFDVIVSRLKALSQNVMARCDPTNPHLVMNILEDECAAILKAAQQAL